MRGFLLAAGMGTRLRPLTLTVPKCLVKIAGRPLLEYWLESLFLQGMDRVLINTHYLAHQVEDYVSTCEWSDRIDLVHEEKLLGTGGSIKANTRFFGGDDACFVAHADNLTSFNLSAFATRHKNRPNFANLTMMTFATDSPETCGIVEEDENGIVQQFHEKVASPPGNIANGAIYIFDQEVLSFINNIDSSEIDFSTQVIPQFVGKMVTYHNDGYLRDIGSPEMLSRAEKDINEGLL